MGYLSLLLKTSPSSHNPSLHSNTMALSNEEHSPETHPQRLPRCKYSKRVALATILNPKDEWGPVEGERVTVGGWIKSCREISKRSFPLGNTAHADVTLHADVTCSELLMIRFPIIRSIAKIIDSELGRRAPKRTTTVLKINDGSCLRNLQVMVEEEMKPKRGNLTVEACVVVEGVLKKQNPHGKNVIHVVAERILHVGNSDPEKYPFARQKLSLEVSRQYPHFRARTTEVAVITRLSDGLYSSTGAFFKANGFLHVQMPIIGTTNNGNHARLSQIETLEISKEGKMDLSVFGGLHLESYACALGNVYTFGPRFKSRDERWMLDAELAFSEIQDVMNCAEDYLKFLCQSVMESGADDMKFVKKEMDEFCVDRLKLAISNPFERITYTDAMKALEKEMDKFESQIQWGDDLAPEHERYLVEEMFERPVIVYDHPKEIRPFNCRLCNDERTVSSFDVIMPKVGILIRGCQKEERAEILAARMKDLGISSEYDWYLDLRRHGTVKHGGFCSDFQAMIMLVSGVENVADVVPFPPISGAVALREKKHR